MNKFQLNNTANFLVLLVSDGISAVANGDQEKAAEAFNELTHTASQLYGKAFRRELELED